MKGELTKADSQPRNEVNLREKVVNFSNKISTAASHGEKNVATIALLATLVAATIVIILWTSAKNYVPLYGNQESYDKANILEILDKEEITFRIDTDSGNILVPQEKLADARITLAARGIKASMPEGIENIGSKVSMGTSQFIESMQYQHALEGELARTIINMQGVRNARVHLAIPKRTLFVGRNEQKTAASVMVDLAPGHELKAEHVEAIISLVIGSVPGLDPRSVSVVDQRGELLSGNLYDSTPIGKETDKKLAFIEKVERNIEQRASIMLLPILGEGNYRIQVSTEVDFSVVEETKEAVDPQNVLKQERLKSDSTEDQFAGGIPGALANQPPLPEADGEEDNNERISERSESSREYENGRSVTHTRYEVGRLTNMSLSVLVNEAASGSEEGWQQANLDALGQMVKTATGYNLERGDQFNITSFAFVEAKVLAPGEGLQWWQMPEVREYARYIFGLLISLVLILFGVRPLVNHLIKGKNITAPAATLVENQVNGASSEHPFERQSTPLDDALEKNTTEENNTAGANANANTNSTIALPKVGSDFEEQIAHMQLLASRETERVTSVIKYWVEQGVESESGKS
ncbi:flagellar basal-body MS-ring/collar protein FliF [Colwellia sp. 4_MG-2023]|uniref:flagellar basal-body MS-ring/collar protein FliF n=1 Tax=unclassified Colwellia TaxID=196834 RepID=UPI0026E2D0E4|nr:MULTISPECIES: flagellar basal-body MS-ring/collar protein FliF [unclassified Colwellia]MDO6508316.1 flagellar basal-body MS-ring/collar protein FliF [Colwellia sp. 5_MG-2023]MDO6556941.1 flagellar basal-body MS-ring/collar protein FliF [Colwellia sp. 4_MG-2023]